MPSPVKMDCFFCAEAVLHNLTKKQVEDLENILPNFKVASAIIHYDETSPHLHIVGVPIKNKSKNALLKLHPDKDGYLRVELTIGLEKKKMALVHRLVAKTFIPNNDNLPEVNHKDENKQNNNVDNLEWCTREYNYNYGTCKDRLKKSNQEKNGKKVKAIKNNKEYHFCSVKEASRILEVDRSNIFACLRGRLKTTKGYRFEVLA